MCKPHRPAAAPLPDERLIDRETEERMAQPHCRRRIAACPEPIGLIEHGGNRAFRLTAQIAVHIGDPFQPRPAVALAMAGEIGKLQPVVQRPQLTVADRHLAGTSKGICPRQQRRRIDQPPVQFDRKPGRADEDRFFGKSDEVQQLCIVEPDGLVHRVTCTAQQRASLRHAVGRDQQVDVPAMFDRDIAISQHADRCALDRQAWHAMRVEQLLQPQCLARQR